MAAAGDLGDGRRPPLLLQHGFLGAGEYWAPQAAALGGAFDVITPDLPGFGAASECSAAGDVESLAASLIESLTQMGIDRCSAVGHSLGGMVVQQAALDDPGRFDRLVLYGTSCDGSASTRFESLAATAGRLDSEGLEAVARRVVETWFSAGAADPWYPRCLEIARSASPAACAAILRSVGRWSVRDRLREIISPTLVVCGEADRSTGLIDARDLQAGIAGAHLAVLPGCAHCAHLEDPALFNRVVSGFLSRGD